MLHTACTFHVKYCMYISCYILHIHFMLHTTYTYLTHTLRSTYSCYISHCSKSPVTSILHIHFMLHITLQQVTHTSPCMCYIYLTHTSHSTYYITYYIYVTHTLHSTYSVTYYSYLTHTLPSRIYFIFYTYILYLVLKISFSCVQIVNLNTRKKN